MSHRVFDKVDLSGQKFHRLTAISKVPGSRSRWICQCECGNQIELVASDLINGLKKSCGCFEKENRINLSKRSYKHGMTDSILYHKWCSMKERCYNPHYKYYKRYGGRGITVCNEWLGEHGFEHFKEWAYSAGYDESKVKYEQTLDRKDTDGNYCPDNCKWSTQLEQVKNRSNSKLLLDTDGESLTADQFDKKHGISADMFTYRRIIKGFSAQQILDEWNIYLEAKNGNYYTKKQAALFYGVSIETITIWMKKGLLRYITARKQIFILKGQPRPEFKK